MLIGLVFKYIFEESTSFDRHENQICNVQELYLLRTKTSADNSALMECISEKGADNCLH